MIKRFSASSLCQADIRNLTESSEYLQISYQLDVHATCLINTKGHFDGLVQEMRNSSALAMKFRLSYTNPSISIT